MTDYSKPATPGERICPRCEHVVERGEWHIPDPEHMGYGACIVQGQPLPHNAAPDPDGKGIDR